jgi:hypothetical protein
MAQTKRKRRSKHRGNAAGSIETRGRTGRPTPSKPATKQEARMIARERRLSTPPTWRASMARAGIAAVLMFVFLSATTKTNNKFAYAAVFAILAFALYVPGGYYMERFLWRRRMARRASRAGTPGPRTPGDKR